MAKAKKANVTIITPNGKTTASATQIHYDSTNTEIVLKGGPSVKSGGQRHLPDKRDDLMTLNWSKRRVSCSRAVDTF